MFTLRKEGDLRNEKGNLNVGLQFPQYYYCLLTWELVSYLPSLLPDLTQIPEGWKSNRYAWAGRGAAGHMPVRSNGNAR